jgi:hypothetical protein
MNRREMIAGALAALATPVRASPWRVQKPPEEFMVEPDRPYTVRFVSQAEVNSVCAFETKVAWLKNYGKQKGNPPVDALGCTDLKTREVFVVRSVRKDPELLEQVVWHEKAHLNGWRH